jgi:hypothetical protein
MHMKLLVKICALAAIAAVTGCTSTSAEWGGERVVFGADGAPLVDKDGVVQKVKEPVRLSSWRHWIDTHVDTANLGVEPEKISFSMNGYKAEPSEELNKLVETSLKGAAELAAKVGAAIASSGGSVAGEAAYTALRNAISKYISKGGSAENATVTCKDGNCTISDGTVTETCTNCMEVK